MDVRRTREHRTVQIQSAEERHELARRAAAESMVLLKNDNGLLPLQPERLSSAAVIGRFAKQPRIQGAGSAKVTPARVDIPWDELQDIAEILFGLLNPSGKLSETFPIKLSDTPATLYPRGEDGKLHYREGLFTGYRYYDRKQLEPQFPFGHGLSYTTFEYASLEAVQEGDEVHVTCVIRNTGTRSGKEVIQLYVNDEECKWVRPDKELKAFAKVGLEPGETKEVHFTLDRRDFSYYNTKQQRWVADTGFFNILVGSSSRDIRLRCRLHCDFGTQDVEFHTFSLLSDWLRYPHSRAVLEEYLADMNRHVEEAIVLNEEFIGFWNDFPLIKIIQMFGQQWLQYKSPRLVIQEMLDRGARSQPADEATAER
ncbi:fibronectin type III-like domain-contianing protein [Paenibacillus dendritiformis]|uniref:fibronectin type III-like domain-contianing protein n=1 Tax=Paenibacillus dendritiformis TaxID=130049 RepID=UPI003B96C915